MKTHILDEISQGTYDHIEATEQVQAVKPLRPTLEDTQAYLADRIARSIMELGDGPTPCQRLQFLGGIYPHQEISQGGICESALANQIRHHLDAYLADTEALNDEIEHLRSVAQRAQQREAQAVLREEELWKAIGIYERAIGNLTDTIRKLKGHP